MTKIKKIRLLKPVLYISSIVGGLFVLKNLLPNFGAILKTSNPKQVIDGQSENTIISLKDSNGLSDSPLGRKISFLSQVHARDRLILWYKAIQEVGRKQNVDPLVIAGIILQESNGKANAVGIFGEIGLMQLTTAALDDVNRVFGKSIPFNALKNPHLNMLAGTLYYKLMHRIDNSMFNSLRRYNGGPLGLNKKVTKIYAYEVINRIATVKIIQQNTQIRL